MQLKAQLQIKIKTKPSKQPEIKKTVFGKKMKAKNRKWKSNKLKKINEKDFTRAEISRSYFFTSY